MVALAELPAWKNHYKLKSAQARLGGFSLSGILRIQEPESRRNQGFLGHQYAKSGGIVCETGRICVR
jgi:hypothetical protein